MTLQSLTSQDFASGMVRDVAPPLIDPRGAYDIRNMVLTEDGALKRRGGAEDVTTSDFDESANGCIFQWTGQTSVGLRTLVASEDNFGVLDGTSITNLGGDGLANPVRPAYIAGLLFIPGGYIYAGSLKGGSYTTSGGNTYLTAGSKTVTDTSGGFTANVDEGMLLQRGNERVYVVADVVSDTELTLRDAYAGSTTTSANPVFHNIYEITDADPYEPSDHYCAAQNKLLWTDGEKVRATKDILSGGPHTYSATEDFIDLPDGVLAIGIAAIGAAALVFSTGGLWTLDGVGYDIASPTTGNVQWRLNKLSEDIVLFGDAGIAYWEQLLVAPCLSGVFLIDGTSNPVKLSQNVEPLYTHYTDNSYRPGGAAVYKGHYLLPVMDDGNEVAETLVCRLDRAALDRRRKSGFPWTRFGGHGGEMRAFNVEVESDPREPTLLGVDSRGRVCDCTYFFNPDANHTDEADGTIHGWSITTRDFTLDGMTLFTTRYLRLLYELSEGNIYAEWGDGEVAQGSPQWNHVQWNHFKWASADEVGFRALTRNGVADIAPADRGRIPHRWRVGKERRRIRFRLRGPDSATCTIRTLEVLTRPPATRRK